MSSMLTTIFLAKAFHKGESEEGPLASVTVKEGVHSLVSLYFGDSLYHAHQ
jgi:hypothetical protein